MHTSQPWEAVLDKFEDVFEPPGMPVDRSEVHKIQLLPGSTPPAKRIYRMSPVELAEVRR